MAIAICYFRIGPGASYGSWLDSMDNLACRLVLVVAVLSLVVGQSGRPARAARAEDKPTTITIGPGDGPPDAAIVLPVSLAPAKGVAVGSVDLRLTFPKAQLAFVRVEPSGLITAIKATVTSEVQEGTEAGAAVLHVTISTAAENGSRQALPDGPLAYLVFQADANAEPQTLTLAHQASATTASVPPAPIAPLVASKAEVVLTGPGATACFFYMH